MRLFVAICFTSAFRQAVLKTEAELKKQAVSGRMTPSENLHLTLAFIGETENIQAVQEAMKGVHSDKIRLELQAAGKFRQEGGDLYWVGLAENPTLHKLAFDLCNRLREKGFPISKREFKAHITIGRQIPADKKIRLTVRSTQMLADRLSLMKSERIDGKLTYTEIYKRMLGE